MQNIELEFIICFTFHKRKLFVLHNGITIKYIQELLLLRRDVLLTAVFCDMLAFQEKVRRWSSYVEKNQLFCIISNSHNGVN